MPCPTAAVLVPVIEPAPAVPVVVAVNVLSRGGILRGTERCGIHAVDQVAACLRRAIRLASRVRFQPGQIRLIVEAGLDLAVELVAGDAHLADGTLGRDGGVGQRGTWVDQVSGCRTSRSGVDESGILRGLGRVVGRPDLERPDPLGRDHPAQQPVGRIAFGPERSSVAGGRQIRRSSCCRDSLLVTGRRGGDTLSDRPAPS